MRNPEWIKELERLRENATPGVWVAVPAFDGADSADIEVQGRDPSTGEGDVFQDREGLLGCASTDDAEYVAALHNALPNLLALIRGRTAE